MCFRRETPGERLGQKVGAVRHGSPEVAGGDEQAEGDEKEHGVRAEATALQKKSCEERGDRDSDGEPLVNLQGVGGGLLLAEREPGGDGDDRGEGDEPRERGTDVGGQGVAADESEELKRGEANKEADGRVENKRVKAAEELEPSLE